MKIDKFVLFIIGAILLAYVFPYWGTKESSFPINEISTVGISLIFFFYGLKLSPSKLKDGLKNYRLHVLVQATTFIVFPILVVVFKPLMQTQEQDTLWLSVFFLAALPSTVSSSVVMVSIAKGNIPAAIFNASISGIIGILVTPLWMGLFVDHSGTDFDFSTIYTQLIIQIIVPVILGLLLHRYLGAWAQRYSKQLTWFDKSIILLIIYKSFASSFAERIFTTISFLDIVLLLMVVLVLFFMVYFLTGFVAKKLNFSKEDSITAQFCGTKKSLVHGTVFSKIIFGNVASIGAILLPIMLFHAIQILLISIIAAKEAKRA